MKIALVVHDFDPGFGQGRYAVELARRLAPQHDVHVYANRFATALEPNFTFQKIPALRTTALSTILTFIRSSEKLLRRRHYDIIHAQGVTCWHANVITAHICNAARQTGQPTLSLKQRFFTAVSTHLERRFYRANPQAQIIGVSSVVADEIQRHYQSPTTPRVIHHGLDTNQFRPPGDSSEKLAARDRYRVPPGDWLWLFVGEGAKGLAFAIRQLPAFPNARLLVISRSNLSHFRQLASSLNVTPRLHFHGPDSGTANAYRAADVLVYPSSYDAFGMVVAEAMASELPVIAGHTIGAAEWINDGKNGLLCDTANNESLRTCLKRIHNEPSLANTLGKAARQTALEHTWDACAQSTLAVYEAALKTPLHK